MGPAINNCVAINTLDTVTAAGLSPTLCGRRAGGIRAPFTSEAARAVPGHVARHCRCTSAQTSLSAAIIELRVDEISDDRPIRGANRSRAFAIDN